MYITHNYTSLSSDGIRDYEFTMNKIKFNTHYYLS